MLALYVIDIKSNLLSDTKCSNTIYEYNDSDKLCNTLYYFIYDYQFTIIT